MTLWRGDEPLVLASQSRTRQTLLANAGLDAEAVPADLDERALAAGLNDAPEIAAHLARAKAQHVAGRRAGHHVIGADQTLALETQHFSKPSARAQAAEQLAALSGKMHVLHSAVCVARDGEVLFETVDTARLTMRPLTGRQIASYLDAAGDQVMTSVGAYQLEGLGVHLFERIEGDHFTILGLPLLPLLDFFRRRGLVTL